MITLFKTELTFGAILFIIIFNNTFAGKRKIGDFGLAHRGTFFLDEIEEMPKELQVKILRRLKEALKRNEGNISKAALDVEMDRRQLQNLIRKNRIVVKEFKREL